MFCCEGDVLVVRWIDRLGRNYQDVTDTIRKLSAARFASKPSLLISP
jgi:DNA invertase Pin-like site-specific DNA recombinase